MRTLRKLQRCLECDAGGQREWMTDYDIKATAALDKLTSGTYQGMQDQQGQSKDFDVCPTLPGSERRHGKHLLP